MQENSEIVSTDTQFLTHLVRTSTFQKYLKQQATI